MMFMLGLHDVINIVLWCWGGFARVKDLFHHGGVGYLYRLAILSGRIDQYNVC